jgi:hypothetical protein
MMIIKYCWPYILQSFACFSCELAKISLRKVTTFSRKATKYIPVFRGQAPLATCLLAALLNYSTTLKMEAIRSSETSGNTQRTTRRHIPEEDTLQ